MADLAVAWEIVLLTLVLNVPSSRARSGRPISRPLAGRSSSAPRSRSCRYSNPESCSSVDTLTKPLTDARRLGGCAAPGRPRFRWRRRRSSCLPSRRPDTGNGSVVSAHTCVHTPTRTTCSQGIRGGSEGEYPRGASPSARLRARNARPARAGETFGTTEPKGDACARRSHYWRR
jgi:hypothetical protein